jgi:hypothetical protein
VRRRDPLSGVRPQPASRGRHPLSARPPASRTAAAAGTGLVLLVVACSASGPGRAPHSGGSGTSLPVTAVGSAPGTAGPSGSPAAGTLSLQVTPAPYQLPSGLAREVVLPHGPDLLIAGGVTLQGTSTAAVHCLNPSTGSTTRVGRLAVPTHDAAGATIGGRPFVFGGGEQGSVATVQEVTVLNDKGQEVTAHGSPTAPGTGTAAGRLPRPRSDLTAVTQGGTTYLLGGYDGTAYDATVLATTDGRRFTVAARLAVPVRYPAVAVLGGQIWVFGGQTSHGTTNDIQRVSLPGAGPGAGGQTVRGRKMTAAAVAGHLPEPTTGAAAFTLGGTVYVAGGQTAPARPGQATASPSATLTTSRAVIRYQPGQPAALAGTLPVPVANAGAGVVGGTAFLVGGDDGKRPVPTVTEFRLVSLAAAIPPVSPGRPLDARSARTPRGGGGPSSGTGTGSGTGTRAGSGPGDLALASAPWLSPPRGRGHLAPHSDPAALPADVLIADNHNNRILVVDPQGRIRWQFPQPGDLARGQTFMVPDDAFFSPNGKDIIATEEDDSVISVINIATHRISYRYGTPGVPGSGPNHVSNPDDAMLLPGGEILSADIKNCRIILVRPPAHWPARIIGHTSSVCWHDPPRRFGSPNGAFPMTNGKYLVTEINGSWVNAVSLSGHVSWSANPPGVSYPSDTNEVYPGLYLTADYSTPGQVVEFTAGGQLRWRFGGLDHPSLALPLPNGDILVNDDYNHRVIVIDPVSNRIVWQYGHTGVAGSKPGYLNNPDGVDVTPPDSMLISHAATMGQP